MFTRALIIFEDLIWDGFLIKRVIKKNLIDIKDEELSFS